jgi:hypothetical protein
VQNLIVHGGRGNVQLLGGLLETLQACGHFEDSQCGQWQALMFVIQVQSL